MEILPPDDDPRIVRVTGLPRFEGPQLEEDAKQAFLPNGDVTADRAVSERSSGRRRELASGSTRADRAGLVQMEVALG